MIRIALHASTGSSVILFVAAVMTRPVLSGVESADSLTYGVRMQETPGTRFDAAPLSSELQNRFVQENQRRIFLLIYRIVRNVDDAQDLTQEAFIKALQRQEQLKDLEKAAHWLSRIASNTAIDFLRRSGRVNITDIEDAPQATLRSHAESAEQRVLRAEHREHLEAGLEILTGRERLALLLRDVEDLPADEVAERLGCSKATVRSHIANARVKLRRFIDRSGDRGKRGIA